MQITIKHKSGLDRVTTTVMGIRKPLSKRQLKSGYNKVLTITSVTGNTTLSIPWENIYSIEVVR